MNRTTPIGALMAVFAVGLAGTALAQSPGGHSHKAPHGGDVVEVAEHHVEFKADSSGTIAIWLLDENQKTATPPAGGKVTLMPDAEAQVTLMLKVDASAQRLTARFDPKKMQAFQAVVSLPIEGKRHNFRFHYPASHHGA